MRATHRIAPSLWTARGLPGSGREPRPLHPYGRRPAAGCLARGLRLGLQLGRGGLSLTVALASASGALLGADPSRALTAFVGVLLLAAGCSALNQFQECDLDRLCARTRQRPLPSGALQPATALAFAILLLSGGFLVFAGGARGYLSVALAGLAVVLYNGVYTPLKRYSALAILPGALAGALPPLIGAAAAGGMPPAALLLAGTILVWQMPHNWLVQLRARDDGDRLALPAFCQTLATGQLRRLVFTWSAAFAALPPVLLLLIDGHLRPGLQGSAVALSLLLIAAGVPLLGAGAGAVLYRRLGTLLRLTLLVFLAMVVLAGRPLA